MQYDDDDQLPMEVGQLFSNEQWFAFRATWPTMLFWVVVILTGIALVRP